MVSLTGKRFQIVTNSVVQLVTMATAPHLTQPETYLGIMSILTASMKKNEMLQPKIAK